MRWQVYARFRGNADGPNGGSLPRLLRTISWLESRADRLVSFRLATATVTVTHLMGGATDPVGSLTAPGPWSAIERLYLGWEHYRRLDGPFGLPKMRYARPGLENATFQAPLSSRWALYCPGPPSRSNAAEYHIT